MAIFDQKKITIAAGSDKYLIFSAWLLVFIISVLTSWFRQYPIIAADELGYLSHARYLSGTAHPINMFDAAYYPFGYSLIIVPFFWFLSNPARIYKAALILNSGLVGFIFILIHSILRRYLPIDKTTAYIGALVATFYPSFWVQKNFFWAENLFVPFFLLHVFLMAGLINGNKKYMVWAGITSAFLYAIHSRGLIIAPISILFISYLFVTKKITLKELFVGVLSLSATLILIFLLNRYLSGIDRLKVNEGYIAAKIMLKVVKSGSGFAGLIRSTLGQLWYLGVGSLFLCYFGIIKAFQAFLDYKRKESGSETAQQKQFYLLLFFYSIGLFIVSCVFMAKSGLLDPNRADHLIYGRYNEGFIALWIGLGVCFLIKESRTRRIYYYLIIGLIILMFSISLRSFTDLRTQGNFMFFNISAVAPLINFYESNPVAVTLGRTTLTVIGFALLIFTIQFRSNKYGLLLVFGYFLFIFVANLGSISEYQQKTLNMTQTAIQRLTKIGNQEVAFDSLEIRSHPAVFYNYQFIAPNLVFTTFNSQKKGLPGYKPGLVIADKTWQSPFRPEKQKFLEYIYGTNLVLWYFGDDPYIIDKFKKEKIYDAKVGGKQNPSLLDFGFYDQEFGSDGRPFRWTNGQARIYFPDQNRKLCSMDGDFAVYNPKGTSLSLLVNDVEIYRGHIMPGQWKNKFFFSNEIAPAGAIVVKINSDVWRPVGRDSRELGIVVNSIRLNSCGGTRQ